MKIGTVPKITVGAVAIIGLGLIGTRHFISPKEDSPPLVEIVTPTLAPQTNFTRKKVAAAPKPADAPEISAQEMQQIESFFAQLEEAKTQQDLEITRLKAFSSDESVVWLDLPQDGENIQYEQDQQKKWTEEERAEKIRQIEQDLVTLTTQYEEHLAYADKEQNKIGDQISNIAFEIGLEAADKDPVVLELVQRSSEIRDEDHRIRREMIDLVGEYLQLNGDYTRVVDLTRGHISVRRGL